MAKTDILTQGNFWTIMTVVIGIISSIFGVMFYKVSGLEGELSAYKNDMWATLSGMNTNITKVQTDVTWIKEKLDNAQISK